MSWTTRKSETDFRRILSFAVISTPFPGHSQHLVSGYPGSFPKVKAIVSCNLALAST